MGKAEHLELVTHATLVWVSDLSCAPEKDKVPLTPCKYAAEKSSGPSLLGLMSKTKTPFNSSHLSRSWMALHALSSPQESFTLGVWWWVVSASQSSGPW